MDCPTYLCFMFRTMLLRVFQCIKLPLLTPLFSFFCDKSFMLCSVSILTLLRMLCQVLMSLKGDLSFCMKGVCVCWIVMHANCAICICTVVDVKCLLCQM